MLRGANIGFMKNNEGEKPSKIINYEIAADYRGEPVAARIAMPPYVAKAVDMLRCGGYDACVVGGCVRDSLLGITPKDWDITTCATPPEIIGVFGAFKLLTHGQKFGTIAVLFEDAPVEITTYRTDGAYSDNRRPDAVSFTANLRDDLGRRDFTINALAFRPECGLIDHFGGIGDLDGGIVRCVGAPRERFGEDALRILRALRFASRFSFKIERNTAEAIHELKNSLLNIAYERICAELTGILTGEADGLQAVLSGYSDVFLTLMPELQYDAREWERTVRAAAALPPIPPLRLVPIFSGMVPGDAREILRRLRFSNDIVDEVTTLVEYSDSDIRADRASVKRLLRHVGEARFRKLMLVRRAFLSADTDTGSQNALAEIDGIIKILDDVKAQGDCYSLKDLDIDGFVLAGLGFAPGKQIGSALWALLELVIEGECPNERGALSERAVKFLRDGYTSERKH